DRIDKTSKPLVLADIETVTGIRPTRYFNLVSIARSKDLIAGAVFREDIFAQTLILSINGKLPNLTPAQVAARFGARKLSPGRTTDYGYTSPEIQYIRNWGWLTFEFSKTHLLSSVNFFVRHKQALGGVKPDQQTPINSKTVMEGSDICEEANR